MSQDTLKWGVKRRLEFIEVRLFWEGRVNRQDLAQTFGISVQQASADLSAYMEHAPGNMDYDGTLKAYVRLAGFRAAIITSGVDRYLLRMVALKMGWMTEDETWFDGLPPYEVVSLSRRRTNPDVLLGVLDAIRLKREISIDYQSMTGTPHGVRRIAPHALAHSAGRWYLRAWSREHGDFRDYHLSRIGQIQDVQPADVDFALDYEWHHQIDLVIVPNSDLSRERQEAVATEYDMVQNKLLVPIRLSLSFYLINEHNLDVELGKLLPEKQQIILSNAEEVAQSRDAARKMSKLALSRARQH